MLRTIKIGFIETECRCVVGDARTVARMKAEANVNNEIGFAAGITAITP